MSVKIAHCIESFSGSWSWKRGINPVLPSQYLLLDDNILSLETLQMQCCHKPLQYETIGMHVASSVTWKANELIPEMLSTDCINTGPHCLGITRSGALFELNMGSKWGFIFLSWVKGTLHELCSLLITLKIPRAPAAASEWPNLLLVAPSSTVSCTHTEMMVDPKYPGQQCLSEGMRVFDESEAVLHVQCDAIY